MHLSTADGGLRIFPYRTPFAEYILDLHPDGSLAWSAALATGDAGEMRVEGSGTWRAENNQLFYTSGESNGAAAFAFEGKNLILDHLPATLIGPGVRCSLSPAHIT